MEEKKGLTGLNLKVIASAAMLLDHIWHSGLTDGWNGSFSWMTWIGRIAFPLFAFGVAEGFGKTKDRRRYLQRMLLFGAVSEVPFDLCFYRMPFYPGHQNVMWTFALSIGAMAFMEKRDEAATVREEKRAAAGMLFCFLAGDLLCTDYGIAGVGMTVLCRCVLAGKTDRVTAGLLLAAINCLLLPMIALPDSGVSPFCQCAAMAGFLLTAFYNGKRGRGGKLASAAGYWFYPCHLLLLWLLGACRP